MATKSFFKWIIMPRDEWRKLIADRSARNDLELRYAQRVEIENDLRKRLAKYEDGALCEGQHCKSCVHACEATTTVIASVNGSREFHDVICALNIPCAKFERKE